MAPISKDEHEDEGWATLPADFTPTSFSQAVDVRVSEEDPNVYVADVKRDWCVGLGPPSASLDFSHSPFPTLNNIAPE
jgi:hypothetical protein